MVRFIARSGRADRRRPAVCGARLALSRVL